MPHLENFPSSEKKEDLNTADNTAILGGEVIKEKTEPVKNAMDSFEKLFYLQSAITHKSFLGRNTEDHKGRERPLFLRKRRADLLKELKDLDHDNPQRKRIIEQAHWLDNVTEQYLNQREITVTLPEYGEEAITARMAYVKPPEVLQKPENEKHPPIFLIPGISNDIECANNLLVELALQGREVVIVGYPEGYASHVTEGFADAVTKDPGFKPHTEFYKTVLDTVLPQNELVEIWGISTGAPITCGILQDEKYQQRTTNAVLMCPAASIDQAPTEFKIGLAKELITAQRNKDIAYPSLNWTTGSKKPREKKQKELRDEIFKELFKRQIKANQNWKKAKVKEGGEIIVVSGEKDKITKSSLMNKEFEEGNKQMKVINLPDAHHMTPYFDPEKIVSKVIELENINANKERLTPLIEYALKQYDNIERALEEFTVEAIRKFEGKIETIPGLVILEVDEDGINLAGMENGELTASATMLWSEIIDLKMDDFEKHKSQNV